MKEHRNTTGPSDLVSRIAATGLFGDLDEHKRRLLRSAVQRVCVAAGATLFVQGTPSDAMYLVLSGCLEVYRADAEGAEALKGEIRPGEPIGEVQFLTGGMHTATARAATDARLIRIPRTVVDSIRERDPNVVATLAEYIHGRLRRYRLYDTLPKLFGALDEKTVADIEGCIEWKRLDGGETLFRQGDAGDSLYVVMSGRLQAVVEDPDGRRRVVGEVTRGESVGEMALFTGEDRSAGIRAVRDTELIRFSRPAFERIMESYPQVVMHIAQLVIRRLRRNITSAGVLESLTNIALVGADAPVDLGRFSGSLVGALSEHTQVIALDSGSVDRLLGTPGISQTPPAGPHTSRLETWLDDLETKYTLVIYQADTQDTNWSRRCLRQADRILIVADATSSPTPRGVEARLLSRENPVTSCSRHLVLLHGDRNRLPADTLSWLTSRGVEKHFHVHTDEAGDFRRLARLLTGRGVGLVLGGGGARGYAHIGVIRALVEAGVPIDMIGGTSMGAVVAAAHAMGLGYEPFIARTKGLLEKHRPFQEYTLPIVSILRSKRLDHFLHEAFGDANIEDLWLSFFCVSTDLSAAEVRVHDKGSVWGAVRSSMSIPGIAVPVVAEGHLLVDGGVLNNLPGDIMKKLCAGTVIAVDVSAKNDLLVDGSSTQIPSPWKILWSRINPFLKAIDAPSILSVMGRTSLLGSISKRNEVMREVDLYLNPPVSRFGMLDNASIEDIAEAGYQYAREKIAGWLADRSDAW